MGDSFDDASPCSPGKVDESFPLDKLSFKSGLIYYSFPHLCLISSLALNVIHLASEGRKSIKELTRSIFCSNESTTHLALILSHMAIFGSGVIAIWLGPTGESPTWKNLIILVLTLPLPTISYILTVRLTIPPRSIRHNTRSKYTRWANDMRSIGTAIRIASYLYIVYCTIFQI